MTSPELLDAYEYKLPDELIAKTPAQPRDSSRLLVLNRKTQSWGHRVFRDFPEYFGSDDILVANNSRVIKARLIGERLGTGGKVEFLLLRELDPLIWEGLFHASAKHKSGFRFRVALKDGGFLNGELVKGSYVGSAERSEHGTVVARFDRDPIAAGAGRVPLPPYIKREPAQEDVGSYQTLYAKIDGSSAAPTAGFHFTEEVFKKLRERGAQWAELTLHVGLGTFRPVTQPQLEEHRMHEEMYEISPELAERLTRARQEGERVTAVGTTSVRALESALKLKCSDSKFEAGVGATSLFIRPGAYEFRAVDRLLTNFHLPKSTLLMLVCAFAGRELTLAAYEAAIKEQYRFYSYGDAMLIL